MMTTTSPQYEGRKAKTNLSAQIAAKVKKSAKVERQAAYITRTSDLKTQGMKSSLGIFRVKYDLEAKRNGTFIIRAVSAVTGEIRNYQTYFEENIRYIGNTDFMAYDKEETYYIIAVISADEPSGVRIIKTVHARAGQKAEVTNGIEANKNEIAKALFLN